MFLNKMFIGDCPLFFNKTVYRRLSNAFEIKRVIEDYPLFLNETKCCIGVRRLAVRTRKSVTHKCITHKLGKEINRHWGYPMCLELQNKKLLFWKKGQGRDALDGFSHLAYAGVRESVKT